MLALPAITANRLNSLEAQVVEGVQAMVKVVVHKEDRKEARKEPRKGVHKGVALGDLGLEMMVAVVARASNQ